MRVFGRVQNEDGTYTWTVVETDANGFNDYIYLTAMIQEIKLNLGESPFWGNRGIPAYPSVVQQVAPDYYTFLLQQRWAPYFLNLIIAKVPDQVDDRGRPVPTYRINVTTNQGVQVELEVPT